MNVLGLQVYLYYFHNKKNEMVALKPNKFLTTTGLILGAVGTLSGISLSSAIATTSFTYGIAIGVWSAITGTVLAVVDFDES